MAMSSSAIQSISTSAAAAAAIRSRSSIPSSTVQNINFKSTLIDKLLSILKGSSTDTAAADITTADNVDIQQQQRSSTNALRASRSNPDIAGHILQQSNTNCTTNTISHYYQPIQNTSYPEHVLKVYRADQSFKYLTVYKETTAHNVVQLALQEFGMTSEGASLEWALCETSVTAEGVIKQKRLPDQLSNLAERIQLNSRYYLKNNARSEPLVPDELAPEILKEAETQLLQLNAQVLAAQLTLQDFAVFSSIEPTEYVDNLFNLDSRYGWPKLTEFEALFNKEMWWVPSEICRERNVQKRAKLVKKLIKVARHCRDFRNFNSMFAIMSGLEKPAVRRLHHTWERVPNKYMKLFEDLQQLIDPSRNMSKYRQHLSEVSSDPPVVPMYPVLKKDLTFSHEGNPTYCDKLINFEKLRMIARAIRSVTRLCSVPYEISVMAQQSGGGVLNDALLHMNNFDGGTSGAVATMRKIGTTAVRGVSQPRKKIYEQSLMVRKVKSYLHNLQVIDDEHQLDRLSLECEASTAQQQQQQQQQQTSSSAPIRRRIPSPSPSTLSTISNTSDQRRLNSIPKFGMESPQAVQKILSLAQNSRFKQHHPATTTTSTTTLTTTTTTTLTTPAQSPLLQCKGGIRIRNIASASSTSSSPLQRTPSLSCYAKQQQQHYSIASSSSSSNTTNDITKPVDLSAESSSVTNLYSSFVSPIHHHLSGLFKYSYAKSDMRFPFSKYSKTSVKDRRQRNSLPSFPTSSSRFNLLFGSNIRGSPFYMFNPINLISSSSSSSTLMISGAKKCSNAQKRSSSTSIAN